MGPSGVDIPMLRVAFENFLLGVGTYAKATDIAGDAGTLTVLRGKGQRVGFATEGHGAFAQVQEFEGVPDIGSAFASQQLTAQKLVELRRSRHCQAMRDWFGQGLPGETTAEVVRRYVDSLGKPSWLEQLPVRMLRFATTSGLGLVHPLAGVLASVTDSFLLSKWFPGSSPRLFLKEAKVAMIKPDPVPRPVKGNERTKGRDRNVTCPCGSGKKTKRCCGK